MYKILLFLLFICSSTPLAFGVTYGSDSAPSRQGQPTFPQADSDNEMNGFAAFENGFVLEDVYTTCTFDSFYPVSGYVNFNHGILYLRQDLVFDSQATLSGIGSIYGNGYTVKFSDIAPGSSPSSAFTLKDFDDLGADPNAVDWSYNDAYILTGKDGSKLFLHSFDGSSLTSEDNSGTENAVNAVRTHPSKEYCIIGTTDKAAGYQLKLWKFSGGSLSMTDSYNINAGVQAVGWSHDGDYIAASRIDDIYVFSFDDVGESISFETSLDYGSDNIERSSLSWDQTGAYFVAGTEDGFRIFQFNSGVPSITMKKWQTFSGSDGEAVDWSPTGSWIAVGLTGATNQLRIFEYNSSTNTLSEKDSITVGGVAVESVHWNSDATRLVVGTLLDGSAKELRVYSFSHSTEELTFDDAVETSVDINSVRWSQDDQYVATADQAEDLSIYEYISGDNFYDSITLDNVSLIFTDDISWRLTTTIQGDCIFDGEGSTFTFVDTAVIDISASSQLTFRNIHLHNLGAQQLICSSDSSSIVFENCTVSLADDFAFDTGSMLFKHDVIFTGTNKLIYSSSMGSTIDSNSALVFDYDTTFKYAPSDTNRDLLYMTDDSSYLFLRGSTLHSTSTGMRLTNGVLWLDKMMTFSSEGDVVAEAICFGNGVSDDDITIKFFPTVDVTVFGELHYNNAS